MNAKRFGTFHEANVVITLSTAANFLDLAQKVGLRLFSDPGDAPMFVFKANCQISPPLLTSNGEKRY